MVASSQANSNKILNIQSSSEALNEWIRNLKSKKQFKRKISRGQDLRSIAILQNSLLTNLKVLRQRQRERSEKWHKIKKMLEVNNNNNEECDNLDSEKDQKRIESLEKELSRKEEIQNIFKEDLSDIDNFMNNLDSIKTALVR